MRRAMLWILTPLPLLAATLTVAQTRDLTPAGTALAGHSRLQSLFEKEWQYELLQSPEFATALGDRRYNDRFSEQSPQAQQADIERRREFAAQFEALDASALSAEDSLSRRLMIRNLRGEIEGAQFKPWEMPVNQFGGPHTEMIDLVSVTPFDDIHDYENYISRLHKVPAVFDEVISNMRLGMHDRLMPPRYLLEKAAAQTQEIAKTSAELSPFRTPLDKFPASISAAEQ
jgi:uncharacterized protein (DUF885 family)